MINRRGLITGLIAFAAAPAIVRASSIMPVKVMKPVLLPPLRWFDFGDAITLASGESFTVVWTADGVFQVS